ncbi:MAG: N-acetylglucosamine kinase [Bacteroidia bacterium]|jgi:N-acetylglucosamine kinase-like BadF-type ATPase
MLLLADSGSTKTDWALIQPGQGLIKRIPTIGFNPYFIDSESIYHALEDTLIDELDRSQVDQVYFYGAGCSTEAKKAIVYKALIRAFPQTDSIQVGHDLLASARALLGKEQGFAAILGTGANTCIYDGNDCILNIDSLGYLLGDEGSGSYIGKKFVRDFMRRQMEPELHKRFQEKFQIESNEQIFQTLYTTQFPNRYLAGFCRFAEDFPDHPYVKNKVSDAFRDFFKNLVSRYPDYTQYTFNCVGSVGFAYKEILIKMAESYQMRVGKIIASPMEDLIQFHLKH